MKKPIFNNFFSKFYQIWIKVEKLQIRSNPPKLILVIKHALIMGLIFLYFGSFCNLCYIYMFFLLSKKKMALYYTLKLFSTCLYWPKKINHLGVKRVIFFFLSCTNLYVLLSINTHYLGFITLRIGKNKNNIWQLD